MLIFHNARRPFELKKFAPGGKGEGDRPEDRWVDVVLEGFLQDGDADALGMYGVELPRCVAEIKLSSQHWRYHVVFTGHGSSSDNAGIVVARDCRLRELKLAPEFADPDEPGPSVENWRCTLSLRISGRLQGDDAAVMHACLGSKVDTEWLSYTDTATQIVIELADLLLTGLTVPGAGGTIFEDRPDRLAQHLLSQIEASETISEALRRLALHEGARAA
jgi:hypothetical protein